MSNNSQSYEGVCPRCEHFEHGFGVCRKLHENIVSYPSKFIKKCNGVHFSAGKGEAFQKAKKEYHQARGEIINDIEMNVQDEENFVPEVKAIQTDKLSIKANKKIVEENSCGHCGGKFTIREEIDKCEKCGSIYHHKCWEENAGCTQASCKEETQFCRSCGKKIKKTANYCPYCGTNLVQPMNASQSPGYTGVIKEASDSLTYAIIGIFCFWIILEPMAIYKGIKALNIISKNPGYKGTGQAIAGIIIGGLILLFVFIAILATLAES